MAPNEKLVQAKQRLAKALLAVVKAYPQPMTPLELDMIQHAAIGDLLTSGSLIVTPDRRFSAGHAEEWEP